MKFDKEFHIYEEDEASSPWVLTVDSIDQWFKVDQLTPGAVFNAKVHPFSPYDIQGHFIWVNESMHTANFTHNPLLITNDTITLQTIFPSGTGVQFNISAEGVFYGAPEHIDSLRVFNFSQLVLFPFVTPQLSRYILFFSDETVFLRNCFPPPEKETIIYNIKA